MAPKVTGRVGRAETCRPHCGRLAIRELTHDRKAIDVGRATLIHAHAERRVALQMLDGDVVLTCGERHICSRHVAGKIDEGFAAFGGGAPERMKFVCGLGGNRGKRNLRSAEAQIDCSGTPGRRRFLQRLSEMSTPLAPPTDDVACTGRPGTNMPRRSSKSTAPPDCECRCTVGDHPPDTHRADRKLRG